jgi:hypothetical protein
MMSNVVGVHVAGSVSAFSGLAVAPDVVTDGVTAGFVVVPVAAITAVGLDGALSDAPLSGTGAENSRIESIPALIVISVVERADVIVRIYDAPAVRAVAVVTVATRGLVAPVIVAIRILSLVA